MIHEERKLEAEAPPGSRFKGCASFLVQDLMIRPHVTDFRRECWQTPDGKTVRAPLPAGVDGHFGPELRRFVLAQYHQGQVTAARLVTLLRGFGIVISKRQVVRLLIAGKQSFLDEARAVLRAGLTTRRGSPPTTPGRATRPRTGSAPRSATRSSPGSGVPSRLVLELSGASSGEMRLSDHAARSMI